MREDQIDYSDIGPLDVSFWRKAKLCEPINKEPISLRIDSDVLRWFRDRGKGYQSLMNSILRTYVEAQKERRSR